MAQCKICPLCDRPGTLSEASEIDSIPSNVRKFREHIFTVWRCSNCESLHSLEEVDLVPYYDAYPFKNHTLDYYTLIAYHNRLFRLKKSGLKQNHRILDFGCGAGLFVEFLKQKGYQNAFGYDSFVHPYSDPSILQQHYDIVTSYDVIEHVDDPIAFYKTMTELVTPNGLLVIGTPEASRLSLSKNKLTPELHQPYHRHILSEKLLLSLAKKFSLTPENIYRRFYFDSPIPFANSRFIWSYIAKTGGMIDVAVEKINLATILLSPRLILEGLFGYFFPQRGNILITFRKSISTERDDGEFIPDVTLSKQKTVNE